MRDNMATSKEMDVFFFSEIKEEILLPGWDTLLGRVQMTETHIIKSQTETN